jgi:uncharacterized protein (UPF0332 family)
LATWEEMSLECLRAAKRLLDHGYLRRSVNSAYYAAYCAVTGELVARGVTFAHGWNNPAHEQVPDLVLNNTTLARNTRYQINRVMRRLRAARENADYRPAATIDRLVAQACLRDASAVLFSLRVKDDRTG